MAGRDKRDLAGVTLLGNQNTKYPMDYAPEVLESFPVLPVHNPLDTSYSDCLIM